jgi:uncharacterized membrane protein
MSDWYYAVDNEQKGPVNESVLKAQLSTHKLSADTLVWKEGMDNWTPASQVPTFVVREASTEPAKFATLTSTPTAVATTPGVHNPESIKPVTVSSLVGSGEALEVDEEDAENHKIFGILAYLGILCLVPLFAANKSPFAKYHANQGLVLFLVEIALGIVLRIVDELLYMVNLGALTLVFSLVWLGVIFLLFIGIINAAAGKCVPLPVIGGFKLLK